MLRAREDHRPIVEIATELTEEVKTLADVGGASLLTVGLICKRFKNDPGLPQSLGFNTFDSWREQTFKGKLTTAKTSLRIVDKLTPIFKDEDLLRIGRVKAVAFCRLPESQRLKEDWRRWVFEEDAMTFKERVKAFIGGKDHREGFCNISIPAPVSFRDETFNRVMVKGKAIEETTDSFIVLEAALTSYEQELDDRPEAIEDLTAHCFVRFEATQGSRHAIKEEMRIAVKGTGQHEDVLLLAAMNKFNGSEAEY